MDTPGSSSRPVRHHYAVPPTLLPDRSILLWRPERPWLAVSSAALGGGLGLRGWVLNMTVPFGYDRTDPDVHLAGTATGLGLTGPGVGLMTAVDVSRRVTVSDGGVEVTATVGLREPEWAAAPDRRPAGGLPGTAAGTVNIVAHVPVRLAAGALVNTVLTAAEAKAQALFDLGLSGTGTATDAVCVLCPADGPAEPYGGPRSTWGARLARAVHAAVRDGGTAEAGVRAVQ